MRAKKLNASEQGLGEIIGSKHSVHPLTPPPFCRDGGDGGGGLNLLPNFEKGGLDRTSTLRGGCWKRRGVKKLKFEISNDKKSL